MKPPRTATLPSRDYQPNKAELQERIKIDVPGKTVEKKMENFAKAILQPVKLKYQDPK